MFKSEGEMAVAMTQDRQFEIDGWICKFDPMRVQGCDSPFICRKSNSDQWHTMRMTWNKYASVKEVFYELEAIKACVINFLLGKRNITAEFVDEILAMDRDSFWITESNGRRIPGFHFESDCPNCSEDLVFEIERQGDVYLAAE